MSISRVNFLPEHLGLIELQDIQEDESMYPEEFQEIKDYSDVSYSFLDEDGTVLCCTGSFQVREHPNCFVWAFLSKKVTPRTFIQIHKELLRQIAALDADIVEMLVKSNEPKAKRWARLLGFEDSEITIELGTVPYDRYMRYK